MTIDDVVASLMRVPIFAGLKPEQIEAIARRAGRCTFECGETIIEAGDAGEAAYLVLDGDASLCTGDDPSTPPEAIERNSLLGELAMLVDHVYGVTVVAEGRVECLKLEREALHALMCEDTDMADRLAQVIRDRLARVACELQEIDELLAAAARIEPALPHSLLQAPAQALAGNAPA